MIKISATQIRISYIVKENPTFKICAVAFCALRYASRCVDTPYLIRPASANAGYLARCTFPEPPSFSRLLIPFLLVFPLHLLFPLSIINLYNYHVITGPPTRLY